MKETLEQLLKPDIVAKTLGIEVNTLYQLVHERRIPYCKVGHKTLRFRGSEIETWLKQGGAGPCKRQRPPKKARKLRAVKAANNVIDALVMKAKTEASA